MEGNYGVYNEGFDEEQEDDLYGIEDTELAEDVEEEESDSEKSENEEFEEEEEAPKITGSRGTAITIDEAKIVPRKDRKTVPKLTSFELANAIGTRAVNISLGATIMVIYPTKKVKENGVVVEVEQVPIDPVEIAWDEFKQKKLPMVIRRRLPNGTAEDWPIHELMYFE